MDSVFGLQAAGRSGRRSVRVATSSGNGRQLLTHGLTGYGTTVRTIDPHSIRAPISQLLAYEATSREREIVRFIEGMRPPSLREWDQIPMIGEDLIRQAKLIAPYLVGQTVAFVGDSDCASLALALLAREGHPCPSRMLVLDFDERLLEAINSVAQSFELDGLIDVRLYNVFDPVPAGLTGQFDWFYTNPPYGSRNRGRSISTFVDQGLSLLRSSGGSGCIILPYDPGRWWTVLAWQQVQQFLLDRRCLLGNKIDGLHHYLLDDDENLTSSLVMVDYHPELDLLLDDELTTSRESNSATIPDFYGEGVKPPYPRYIRSDGSLDFSWPTGGDDGPR